MTDSLTKQAERKMNQSGNPQNLSNNNNNSVLHPRSLKVTPKTIAKPKKDCFYSAFSDSDSNDGSDRSPQMNLQKFLEMPDLGNDYLDLGSKDSEEKQTDLTFDALPPANPLITEKYSLDADMIFGWKPKSVSKAPIPLKFSTSMVEDIIESFVEEENENNFTGFPELVYQGFRPDNSFFAHEKFSSPETYTFRLSHLLETRHTYLMKHIYNENPERPFVGMKKDVGEDCLTFNSVFEGGNLDTVIRTGYDAYDLFIRTDSNTKGHTNWYYFKVGNMKKGQTVTFNIVNFSRSSSLYQQGMKPYIYSEKQFQEKKVGWSQQGENISYRKSFIGYHGHSFTEPKLSFEYTFSHDDDTVSFALGVPYTYTQLLQFLQTITDAQKDLKEKAFVNHTNLTYSLGGVIVPLLTITDPDESEFQLSKRQHIICTGRVHPGEANSSYMLEGLISEICKDSEEARYLRKRFIFKIVPMLNPDGVIIGNHRSGMCGNDLNRQFLSPNETLHPSVQAMVDLVKEIATDKKDMIFAYIDFHGHSQRKSVFCYGPEFPIHSENYFKARIIPKILSKRTAMFRYRACNYIIPKYKLGTARAVFSMHYGVTNCFTLEASYSSYLSTQRETIPFKADDYMLMGARVCDSFYEYQKLIEEEAEAEAEKNNKALLLKKKEEENTLESELEDFKSPELKSQKLSDIVTVIEEPKVESEILKTSPREGRRKTTTKFRIKKQKGVSVDGVAPKSKKNRIKDKEKGGSKIALNNTYVEDSKAIGRGIAKLLSEIKKDNASELLKNKIDDVPVDSSGSDNEGPEDDFASDEMRRLQGGILNQINLFQSLCKEKDFEEKFQTLKKKLVIEKPKKATPPNVEKEKTESPQNPKTYRKASMTPPRQYQKTMGGGDWSSQLRQRVPVVPREMLIVFDKQINLAQPKEQAPLYLNGSPLGTKRKGVRHLINANANLNPNLPEPVPNSYSTRESPNKKPMKSKPIIGFPLHGQTAVQGQTFIQYSSRPNPDLLVKPKPRAPSITQNRWAGESPEKEADSTIFERPFHRAYKLLLGNSKARISTQNDTKADFEDTSEQIYTEGAIPRKDESEFEKAYKMTQFLTGKPIFKRILASRGKTLPDNSANSAANIKKDKKFSVLYEIGRKIIKDKKSKKVFDYKLFASNTMKEDDNR